MANKKTEAEKKKEKKEICVKFKNNVSVFFSWFLENIFIQFIAVLFSFVFFFFRHYEIDTFELIGTGELIIVSVSIILSYIIKIHKRNDAFKNSTFFITALFVGIFQVAAYSGIKMSLNILPNIVYITSALCVSSSIIIAFICEKHIGGFVQQ